MRVHTLLRLDRGSLEETERGDGVRRDARDVTSGARAPSVGTGGRCASESQRREWSRAGRKGEEDLERGESQDEEEVEKWAGGEDRG